MTINKSNVDWREQRRERGGGQVEEGSGREHRHRQVGQVEILDGYAGEEAVHCRVFHKNICLGNSYCAKFILGPEANRN